MKWVKVLNSSVAFRVFTSTIIVLLLVSCSKDEITATNSNNKMKVTVGNTVFTARLDTNAAAKALKAMLPLTLNMSDFNNNEKVTSLSVGLPTSASNPGLIQTGDIMLFGSSSLVLFYETFKTSYSYTRLGWIENFSELKKTLGSGNVIVKFEQE